MYACMVDFDCNLCRLYWSSPHRRWLTRTGLIPMPWSLVQKGHYSWNDQFSWLSSTRMIWIKVEMTRQSPGSIDNIVNSIWKVGTLFTCAMVQAILDRLFPRILEAVLRLENAEHKRGWGLKRHSRDWKALRANPLLIWSPYVEKMIIV